MKLPAVVNFAPKLGSVEIREIEQPAIGDIDVLLEVAHVGVCGSDLHQWTADHSWPVNYPVVLGHEFSGRIAGVGKAVRGWREGDRVVSETAADGQPGGAGRGRVFLRARPLSRLRSRSLPRSRAHLLSCARAASTRARLKAWLICA